MSHKYNENAEYCLVKGWFEDRRGLNESKFYGACFYEDDPFTPYRVVLEGEIVKTVAKRASENPTILEASSLHEKKEKKIRKNDDTKIECPCGHSWTVEGDAANPKCAKCGAKHGFQFPTSESLERDDDDEVIIEKEPAPDADAAPGAGAKNSGKIMPKTRPGRDGEGTGDLKSEGKQVQEEGFGPTSPERAHSRGNVSVDGQDVPITSDLADTAKPEPTDEKSPHDKNVENLQKFYADVSDAIGKCDSATKIVLGFGIDGQIDKKLAKAHKYLFSVRDEFMRSKGAELKSAGVDIGLSEGKEDRYDKWKTDPRDDHMEHDDDGDDEESEEGTLDEMTGSGGVGFAGGYETLAPAKPKSKKSKKSKSKKSLKEDNLDTDPDPSKRSGPGKFAQQPSQKKLGMTDRGQGSGSNRVDGLDPKKLNEDVRGDIKFTEPEKLVTVGVEEEAVEEQKLPKKPKMPCKPRKMIKSVGNAKTGKFGGQGVHEDIGIGTRVEIKDAIEENYKHMNGLRGRVVAVDSGDDPIRIRLDEARHGDENGCINARTQELTVVSENKDIKKSEAIEFSRWLANSQGVTTEKVVQTLGREVMEWAEVNKIDELMPHKQDLLPVFIVVLEGILNG